MTKLTGTKHGDAASSLVAFYLTKARQLEDSRQYFMAGVALAFAVETAILAYLLVEFNEENGGELKIPSSVNFWALIEAANEIDVLTPPVPSPGQARRRKRAPRHVAKEVVHEIKQFRNLIHPARALKEGFDPRNFRAAKLRALREKSGSVIDALMENL